MTRRASRVTAWLLACVIALACPRSASAFGDFSIRDELELARKFDLIIETRFPVIEDTRITGYVQSLVDRIVAAMPTTRNTFPSSRPPCTSSRREALARSAESSQLL